MSVDNVQLIKDVEVLRNGLGPLPEPVANPALVIVSGLPGTGKSHFSRRLAERIPLAILETDALRRALFPSPGYTVAENKRLFQASHYLLEELIRRSIRVLFDATNLVERFREHIYHIVEQAGVKLIIVRVEAPSEVVRERLGGRDVGANPQDHSEAGWAVYQRMKPAAQPIRRQHFVVDTSRDTAPVLEKIVRELRRY